MIPCYHLIYPRRMDCCTKLQWGYSRRVGHTLLSAKLARSSTFVFIVAENSSVCRPTGQDLTSSDTSSWNPSSSRRSAFFGLKRLTYRKGTRGPENKKPPGTKTKAERKRWRTTRDTRTKNVLRVSADVQSSNDSVKGMCAYNPRRPLLDLLW